MKIMEQGRSHTIFTEVFMEIIKVHLLINCQHLFDHQKSKRVPEKACTSDLLTVPKPLTVWITTDWKILQEVGTPFPSPMHESEVAQLCLTLRDPIDTSPPGSSIHGIFQARVLEWVAIAFSAYTLRKP